MFTTTDSRQIERIVEEVLRRLGTGTADPTTTRWDGPLLTAIALENQLAGATSLTVPDRCVVTPAARDWLRERGIPWNRGAATERAASPVHLIYERSDTPVAWPGAECCPQVAPLLAAVRQACRRGQRVVVRAARPHAVACQGNRDESLRMVAVTAAGDLPTAMAEADANVVVASETMPWDALLRFASQWSSAERTEP